MAVKIYFDFISFPLFDNCHLSHGSQVVPIFSSFSLLLCYTR